MPPRIETSPGLKSAACALLFTLGAACAPAEPTRVPEAIHSPFTGYASARYGDARMWLCRPDLPRDACRTDLTATEIRADGSRAVVPHVPAKDPEVDCFYVYPTVDDGFLARNHADFDDRKPMTDATVAQVAHFTEACSLYVPLYRQVTLGTYLAGEARREGFLSVAFSDVEDAFLHYMGQYNHGHKVVLIGHSQGAEMITRLLRKRFDADPAMRERLVVALPIGGRLEVARGQRTGGTFANIPVCAAPDETGCVIGFRSYAAGKTARPGPSAPGEGRESVCVNPAGTGLRSFSRTMLPLTDKLRSRLHGLEDVRTPFVIFPGFYAGQCVDGPEGFRYLEIRAAPPPGDVRESPFDLGAWVFGTTLGLHILDFQFPEGDLIDLVKRKANAAR